MKVEAPRPPFLDKADRLADHPRPRMARLGGIVGHGVRILASLLFVLAFVADARATTCDVAASQWAAECAAQGGIDVKPLRCSSGFASFRVDHRGASLDVEVRSDGGPAFRRVGRYGVSPIGEFADWSAEPEELRSAFDAFVACAAKGIPGDIALPPTASGASLDDAGPTAHRPVPHAPAFRLWGGLVAALVVAVAWAMRRRRARVLRTVAMMMGLGAATWGLRRLVLPFAFFHQNGHGPMWVDCALGGRCGYGPGFREIFGPFALASGSAAEEGVFLAHSVLGATAPIATWALARAASAPRLLALALAVVVAIEPGSSRLAQSESYFGVVTWLLFAAAAVLATAARFASWQSLVFTVAMCAAGLLIAEAAVVHPIAWVPSALVPAVVLLGRGAPKRRLRLFATATVGTGLVAAGASGTLVAQIYAEHRRWGSTFGGLVESNYRFALFGAVAVGGLYLALRRLRRVRSVNLPASWPLRIALCLALLIGPLLVARALHPFGGLTPWIRHAWWLPYLPVALAAVAALLASLTPRRPRRIALASGIVVACGALFAISRFGELTTLPTDALESQFVASVRHQLPAKSRVLHIERVDNRIATLPIYRGVDGNPGTVRLVVKDGQPPRPIGSLPTHYYRSSVCTSEEGRPYCDAIERDLVLEPVATAVLPALPSMPHMPYDRSEVSVGFFRVVGRAGGESAMTP